MKQCWIIVLGIWTGSLMGMMDQAGVDFQGKAKNIMQNLKNHLLAPQGLPEVTSGYINEFIQLKKTNANKFTREFYLDLVMCELPIMSGYVQTYQDLCELQAKHKITTDKGVTNEEMILFANVRANNLLVDAFMTYIKNLAC